MAEFLTFWDSHEEQAKTEVGKVCLEYCAVFSCGGKVNKDSGHDFAIMLSCLGLPALCLSWHLQGHSGLRGRSSVCLA